MHGNQQRGEPGDTERVSNHARRRHRASGPKQVRSTEGDRRLSAWWLAPWALGVVAAYGITYFAHWRSTWGYFVVLTAVVGPACAWIVLSGSTLRVRNRGEAMERAVFGKARSTLPYAVRQRNGSGGAAAVFFVVALVGGLAGAPFLASLGFWMGMLFVSISVSWQRSASLGRVG